MELDGVTLEIGFVYAGADGKNKEVWQIGQIVELAQEIQLVSGGYDETVVYKPSQKPMITGTRRFWTLGAEIVAAEEVPEAQKRERVALVRRDTREDNPLWAVCLKKDFSKWLKDKGLELVKSAEGDFAKDVQAVGIAPLKKKTQKVTA